MTDSPGEVFSIDSGDLPIEDFKNLIKFAKIFAAQPADRQTLELIVKPLPSPDIKIWLKEYPEYQTILTEMAIDKELLFGLLIAANFTGQVQIADLAGCMIASYCIGKEVEQLREYFGVVSDFTPEQEQWMKEEREFAQQLF